MVRKKARDGPGLLAVDMLNGYSKQALDRRPLDRAVSS